MERLDNADLAMLEIRCISRGRRQKYDAAQVENLRGNTTGGAEVLLDDQEERDMSLLDMTTKLSGFCTLGEIKYQREFFFRYLQT